LYHHPVQKIQPLDKAAAASILLTPPSKISLRTLDYQLWSSAMALQHNVLENGEWVTRTLEAQELFRQTSASAQAKPKKQPSMPPDYGILTKTVIESPVIQRVLPAQLRSPSNNDVAFIGVGAPPVSQYTTQYAYQNHNPVPHIVSNKFVFKPCHGGD
jgi:hypothetical protein